uniref:Palmitoyltransferase n=1 Tax=Romanomermis culicivorax TaxID=13658 RepID=A0A915JPK5_ROMCU
MVGKDLIYKERLNKAIRSASKNLSLMTSHSDTETVRATQYGDIDTCIRICENGFNVNQRDSGNCTLLHWASINNRLQIIKYFLSKNADINAIGGELKSTPLYWAARQGNLLAVALLVKNGANFNIRDCEGSAPIHVASQFGHTPIVAYLVAKGCDINVRDRNLFSPLIIAVQRCYSLDPIQLLLTLGADCNARDYNNNTALHWAVTKSNYLAVSLLTKFGCDVSCRNSEEITALQIAQKKKDLWLTSKLEEVSIVQNALPNVSLLLRLKHNKVFVQRLFYLLPFLIFFCVGALLESNSNYISKILLGVILYGAFHYTYSYFSNEKTILYLPFGVYLSTKFWMYATWLFHFSSLLNNYANFLFALGSIGLFYNFFKTWLSDPGVLSATLRQKLDVLFLSMTTNERLNAHRYLHFKVGSNRFDVKSPFSASPAQPGYPTSRGFRPSPCRPRAFPEPKPYYDIRSLLDTENQEIENRWITRLARFTPSMQIL